MERVKTAIKQLGKRFLNCIYTEAELRTCQDGFSSLASRFTAKEAVMKVLGTGGWVLAGLRLRFLLAAMADHR